MSHVSLSDLSPVERYAAFVTSVAGNRHAWGLVKEGWALSQDPNGDMHLLLWFDREDALRHATDGWDGYEPVEIDLRELMDGMLPSLEEANMNVAVSFEEGADSVCASPAMLRAHLQKAVGRVN